MAIAGGFYTGECVIILPYFYEFLLVFHRQFDLKVNIPFTFSVQ